MFSIIGEGIGKYAEVEFCSINVFTWSRVEQDTVYTEWETCLLLCIFKEKCLFSPLVDMFNRQMHKISRALTSICSFRGLLDYRRLVFIPVYLSNPSISYTY